MDPSIRPLAEFSVQITPSMRDLAVISIVVLPGISFAYFFAFRLYRREFFRFIALAWIANAVYILSEWMLGASATIPQHLSVIYLFSLFSTLFFFVAGRDLRASTDQSLADSTDPRNLIPLISLAVVGLGLSAVITWSIRAYLGSAFLPLLVMPGTAVTSVILVGIAKRFSRMSDHQMLEFLHRSDMTNAPSVLGVASPDLKPFGTSDFGAAVSRPIAAARRFYVLGFGGYGLMQLGYFVFSEQQLWPFWIALCLKLLVGAALPIWLLGDFRYVSETVRRKSVAEEIGALTASIEHDIRNPISIIMKILVTAKDRYQQDSALAKQLAVVSAQVDRIVAAADIIPAMREGPEFYAKQFKPWNPLDLCRTAVGNLKTQYMDQMPKVSIDAPAVPLEVKGYRERLIQALVNVVNNSVEALRDGPRNSEGLIAIRIGSAKGMAVVSILDNGPGIPPHVLPSVTIALFSTKNTSSGGQPNRGLGLFISERIIQQHGGQFQVRSDGRTFTEVVISVPLFVRHK